MVLEMGTRELRLDRRGHCSLWAGLDSTVWCYYRWRWWRWRQRVASTSTSTQSSRVNDDFCLLVESVAATEGCQSETTTANVLFFGMFQVVKADSSTSTSILCVCYCMCVCVFPPLLCCLGIAIDNNSR